MAQNWRERFGTEWDYVVRLGSAMNNPEEKKAFWEMVKEKKQANENYSIYSDFPIAKGEAGMRICGEILEMLRGRK